MVGLIAAFSVDSHLEHPRLLRTIQLLGGVPLSVLTFLEGRLIEFFEGVTSSGRRFCESYKGAKERLESAASGVAWSA